MWKPSTIYHLQEWYACACSQGGRLPLSYTLRNASRITRPLPLVRCYSSKTNDDSTQRPTNPSKSTPQTSKVDGVQYNQSVPSSRPSDEDFVLPSLSRPIGLIFPPEEGQNTGIDTRTLRQRRDDFVDYDRHLARRKDLYTESHLFFFFFMPLADISCTELDKRQNRISESGRICDIMKEKPSFRARASFDETRPCISPTCTASHWRHPGSRKTPLPSSEERYRL